MYKQGGSCFIRNYNKDKKHYSNKKFKGYRNKRNDRAEKIQPLQKIGNLLRNDTGFSVYKLNRDTIPKSDIYVYNGDGEEIGKVLEVFGTKGCPYVQIEYNEGEVEKEIYSYRRNLFYSNYNFND